VPLYTFQQNLYRYHLERIGEMNDNQTGQVTQNGAETYEEFLVPALFQEWAERVVDAAQIETGQHVLDVACGTGVLARAAAKRVGPKGSVIGLDVNEGMLAVAERKAPQILWKQGRAESLPFDDHRFDVVVSQFGLMFFQDRSAAIHEMSRVLVPSGRLAVAVWDKLENTPGFAALVALLERLFGTKTAETLSAPFSVGNMETLLPLFRNSNLQDVQVTTINGTARFSSIRSWVFIETKGWTLGNNIDEDQYEHLLEEAERELQPYVISDGTVEFRIPAHIVTASKE
jgi:ubiquinone/menaquinone biosynthesis C-methylase UbiE